MSPKHQRFLALYEPVRTNLDRFVLAMMHDTEIARDVVAETVLIAYERLETLRNPTAFLAFLFTIASRVGSKHRSARDRTERISGETIAHLLSPETPPDVLADIGALYDALQQLPDKQREAVVLFEISGLPMKKIREIQGGTLTAVKVRISRGRKRLGEILQVDPNRLTSREKGESLRPHGTIERNQFKTIEVGS